MEKIQMYDYLLTLNRGQQRNKLTHHGLKKPSDVLE